MLQVIDFYGTLFAHCLKTEGGSKRLQWTCTIIADLLKQEFNITVGHSTIRLHLKAMNFSCQKPEYQDIKIDDKDVENFLNKKFPLIQQVAKKIDADIAFEDEAGVGVIPSSTVRNASR